MLEKTCMVITILMLQMGKLRAGDTQLLAQGLAENEGP